MVGEFFIGYNTGSLNNESLRNSIYSRGMTREEFEDIVKRLYHLEEIGLVSDVTYETLCHDNIFYHFNSSEGEKVIDILR